MMITQIIGVMIPIVAIVMGIGIGMLALFLNYRKRKEMFALYHQQRMAAIEKGIELPPMPEAFFAEDGKASQPCSPHRHLLSGLVLLFLGLAIMVALYIEAHDHFIWGLVPTGLGLAFLIYYFTVGKKYAEELAAARIKAVENSRIVRT